MNTARLIVAGLMLAVLLAIAGCQQGYSSGTRVRWAPTETGWWQPDPPCSCGSQGQ